VVLIDPQLDSARSHGRSRIAAVGPVRPDTTGGIEPDIEVVTSPRRGPSSAHLAGQVAAAKALETINSVEKFAQVISELRAPPSKKEIHAASTVHNLTALGKKNQHGEKPPLHFDRTSVSLKTTKKLEPAVDAIMDNILRECVYVGLQLDKSKSALTTHDADPSYVSVTYCTPDFVWGVHLVGQTDTSICTTSKEHLEGVKKVFTKTGRGWLWDKILLGSTDGCAAMRSTRLYEGLHPRPVGKSFLRLR
jgi:hypothetical protein